MRAATGKIHDAFSSTTRRMLKRSSICQPVPVFLGATSRVFFGHCGAMPARREAQKSSLHRAKSSLTMNLIPVLKRTILTLIPRSELQSPGSNAPGFWSAMRTIPGSFLEA